MASALLPGGALHLVLISWLTATRVLCIEYTVLGLTYRLHTNHVGYREWYSVIIINRANQVTPANQIT